MFESIRDMLDEEISLEKFTVRNSVLLNTTKAHHKFFLCCSQLLHTHAVHLLLHIAFIVDIYRM